MFIQGQEGQAEIQNNSRQSFSSEWLRGKGWIIGDPAGFAVGLDAIPCLGETLAHGIPEATAPEARRRLKLEIGVDTSELPRRFSLP
jgi:hypothetical protein